MKKNTQILMILAASLAVSGVHADVFGTGPNQFNLDFVNIEEAGNPADNTGYGAVAYNYRMGKFEVTVDQFAKAYAADSNISNGDEGFYSGIGSDAPAVNVSFYEAAKFANWLTSGSYDNGAYTINGSGEVTGVDRGAAIATYGTAYVIPTENEWYKAAYHKTDPTYGNYRSYPWEAPTTIGPSRANYVDSGVATVWVAGSGDLEQNGTYDMAGNVSEWTESEFDGGGNIQGFHAVRGGAFDDTGAFLKADNSRNQIAPQNGTGTTVGFRVAAIPEPGTMSLMGISTCGLFITRRVRRRKLAGSTLMPIRRRPNACDVFDLDGYQHAQEVDAEEENYLSILMDHMIDWTTASASWIYKNYKSLDVMFWDRMVVSHEKRVIRSKARKANFKKKALAGFDAFLALIMK